MSARLMWRSVVAGGVLVAALATLGAPASAHGAGPNCERVIRQVTLSPTTSTTYKVVGGCAGRATRVPVQVLNSGFTYGSYYWNLPYQPERYSYVRAATQAGFAALNIDRIGVGQGWLRKSKSVHILKNYGIICIIVQPNLGGSGDSFCSILRVPRCTCQSIRAGRIG